MSCAVFVSFTIRDKAATAAVVAGLEHAGIRCWVAPRDIKPGASWAQAVTDAIDASRCMVIIFSGNSNQSNQVLREVERAAARNVSLVPFQIEQTNPTGAMAYLLSAACWLDAAAPPLAEHIARLVDTIQGLLSAKEVGYLLPGTAQPAATLPEVSIGEPPSKMLRLHNELSLAPEQPAPVGEAASPWLSFLGGLSPPTAEVPRVHDRWDTLNQLRRTLALSVDTLRSNPQELPGQLVGRLSSSTNAGVIDFLSSLDLHVQHPWFRPRNVCLPGPDSPILASWSILDEVPACRLLVSDNSRVVSMVTRDTQRFWDLDTGFPLTPLEAEPHFPQVDWALWSADLPDQQFEDSEGTFNWAAATPPGPFRVSCSLERAGGSAFNRRYENRVTFDHLGEVKELTTSRKSEVFASEGFLAASISTNNKKIICGGLAGAISAWDLASGSLEISLKVGNRTIIAVAGFPDPARCAALTLDGQLLIVDTTLVAPRKQTNLAPPVNLYLSRDQPLAVVTHLDGSVLVWSTQTQCSFFRRPDWFVGSPYATFRLTPDLSVAVISGHGEDQYDGWLLNVVSLLTGDELFSCETKMSNDMFGAVTLEQHDNHLYMRIDPIDKRTSNSSASSSYTDVSNWVNLASGQLYKSEPPTRDGMPIKWASSSSIKKTGIKGFAPWFIDTPLDPGIEPEGIMLSADLRTILVGAPGSIQAQFSMDENIDLLGVSPHDHSVVFVTRAGLHVLDPLGMG